MKNLSTKQKGHLKGLFSIFSPYDDSHESSLYKWSPHNNWQYDWKMKFCLFLTKTDWMERMKFGILIHVFHILLNTRATGMWIKSSSLSKL